MRIEDEDLRRWVEVNARRAVLRGDPRALRDRALSRAREVRFEDVAGERTTVEGRGARALVASALVAGAVGAATWWWLRRRGTASSYLRALGAFERLAA